MKKQVELIVTSKDLKSATIYFSGNYEPVQIISDTPAGLLLRIRMITGERLLRKAV